MDHDEHDVVDADVAPVDDGELRALLHRVYVDGGFTDPDVADDLFASAAVRKRGRLLVARHRTTGALAGVVIMAPPTSPGRRIANADEAEMHLLGVSPDCRGRGIGALLVRAVIERAQAEGHARMVLWTQPSMSAAHRLYERFGFTRSPERDWTRRGRRYLVYERSLSSKP